MDTHRKTTWIVVAGFVALVIVIAICLWSHLYRVVPQPAWITADQRDNFLYGSVDAQDVSGIPYWIWLAMPRTFPEYMPGVGGYAAFGVAWEEGREMPAGFAKQRIGYIRVTGNCALCHTTFNRNTPDAVPAVVPAVAGHVTDIKPLMTFFTRCAQDPRFNADEILSEVETATKLSLFDRLLYRYVLIPRTRKALLDPAPEILAPPLLLHAQVPQSETPFSDSQMKALRDAMKQLEAAPSP
jgi:hypothetical protein